MGFELVLMVLSYLLFSSPCGVVRVMGRGCLGVHVRVCVCVRAVRRQQSGPGRMGDVLRDTRGSRELRGIFRGFFLEVRTMQSRGVVSMFSTV